MASVGDRRQAATDPTKPRSTSPSASEGELADEAPRVERSAPVQQDTLATPVAGRQARVGGSVGSLIERSGGTVKNLEIKTPTLPRSPRLDIEAPLREVRESSAESMRGLNRELDRTSRNIVSSTNRVVDGVESLDRRTPALTQGAELAGRAGRVIVDNTPRGAARRVNQNTASASRWLAGRVPAEGNYRQTIPMPLFYDDQRGNRVYIPAGAQLVAHNGTLRLSGNGAFVTAGGVTVNAGRTTITLGPQQQTASLDRFQLLTDNGSLDARGMVTQLGADGSFLTRAESMNIDLPRARIRVRGAEIASPNANYLRAGVDALSVVTPSTTVTAGRTGVSETTTGRVSTWAADTTNLDVVTRASNFHADQMTLSLSRNAATREGALRWAADGVRYSDGQTNLTAASAALGFTRNADGSSVFSVRGRDVNTTVSGSTFGSRGQTSLEMLYDTRGQLTDLTARGDDVRFRDQSTAIEAVGAHLHTTFDANGLVTSIDAGSNRFDLQAANGNRLRVSNGAVNFTRDGAAVLAHATAESATYTTNKGTFDLGRNGTLDMNITRDAVTATGTASQFTYTDRRGSLAFVNGRVDVAAGEGVSREFIRFSGDQVRYDGSTTSGQLSQLSANNASAELSRDANGLNLALRGQNVDMTVDGHHFTAADARVVDIATNASGQISNIDLLMPGRAELTTRGNDVNVGFTDLQGHYEGGANERLRIGFSQGDVSVRSLGLTGHVGDGRIEATTRSLDLHAGTLDVNRSGSDPFSVNARNLNAGLRLDADGRVSQAFGDVSRLDATYRDVNIRVNGQEGESVSFSTRFNGGVFTEGVLNIPGGSQVVVASGANSLTLGQQQTRLTQGEDGSLRLQSTNFHTSAVWDGIAVRADGQNFDATLAGNELRLNRISGTNISVKARDYSINVNVRELDNLLLRATGISGLATGAAITLTPTADNSRITANISANYAGIPVSLDINDARQLEALAMVQTNEARVLVRDASGRGQLRLSAGPLSISGQGTIGAVATYHRYDVQRMTEQVSRLTDQYQVTPNLRLGPSGTIGVGLYDANQSPVRLGVTAMIPRRQEPPFTPVMESRPVLVPDEAPGVVLEAGVNTVDRQGIQRSVSLYGGVVPGSYVDVQVQGQARLYGVPLPNSMQIPTTAIAGVRFERTGPDYSLAAIAGVQANIPRLKDTTFGEPAGTATGVHVGGQYSRDNFSANVGATVDQGGGWGVKAGVRWSW